jgi:ABC-type lipoprotein release transport system permease subunit
MNLIFTIAWRNIFRHKGKTFVIGTILFLGALIMTLGNGVISGLNQGLEENIINSFTGHLVIISENQQEEAVLLSMSGQTIEPIRNYLEIKESILEQPYIKDILPVGIGYVWVLNDAGQPVDQYIIGVDFPKYYKFFNNNLTAIEGRLIEKGERGVLVPVRMRELLYDFCNFWVIPKGAGLNVENLSKEAKKNQDSLITKDEMVFLGLSRKNASLDILCDIYGVVKFRALNSLLGFYSFVDIESLRECMGYFSVEDSQTILTSDQSLALEFDEDNLDSFFEDAVAIDTDIEKSNLDIKLKIAEKKVRKNVNHEEGVFNAIYVKLNPGVDVNNARADLNEFFKEKNMGLKVIRWDKAIGMMGQMAIIMKISLFILVFLIFAVAIIIIMNTLIISALERISEIGMMRAVGARKSFISRMFLSETFLLSISFGGSGIVLGSVIIKILASLDLTTKNEILQIFYGGDTFHPLLTMSDVSLCLLQLLIVTLLACIYPILVARKITALDAISRD